MSGVYETDHNILGVWKYVGDLEYGASTFWLCWWAHQDSNLGPSDYESDALTN